MNKIKVLIVDDSAIARDFLEKGLSLDPMIEVVAKASNAQAAKDKILFKKPDVLTLDIEMPGKNGLDFLKELMIENPMPVVMVSALTESGSKITLDALESGAVDFVLKASTKTGVTPDEMFKRLREKIKIASKVDLTKFYIRKEEIDNERLIIKRKEDLVKKTEKIIAIGASTGGTQAITQIIKEFPKDIPGTVIVQHMPPVFTRMFAERLNDISIAEVKEAENGDIITNGKVYIAPGGMQMEVVNLGGVFQILCKKGEPVNGHCPSVDVLFDSIAVNVGSSAIGVILTGMGKDGAKGLLRMKEAGARTIAQDEKSSIIFGMPMEANKIGGAEKLIGLNDIANYILGLLN